MRTYKENVIELDTGENLTIRSVDHFGKHITLRVQCVDWPDYEGNPDGFIISSPETFQLESLVMDETHSTGKGNIEVLPDGLVLSDDHLPVCERCGKKVTDDMPSTWAPFCSHDCKYFGLQSIPSTPNQQ